MLKYTINKIINVAYQEPLVNTIVRGDIFRINTKPECRYGVFAVIQNTHSSTSDFWNFGFTFYYVDRLTADKKNEIDIHDNGIFLLNKVCDALEISNVTYTTFLQKFNDECAGVFCSVVAVVPKDLICDPTDYYDFNEDFNDDFLIKGL